MKRHLRERSWPGLVFDRVYGRVFNIFNIKMFPFLGFLPSLTSYEVLEVWLIRQVKKVRQQTCISLQFSKEELYVL